jgi:hypothetical protein
MAQAGRDKPSRKKMEMNTQEKLDYIRTTVSHQLHVPRQAITIDHGVDQHYTDIPHYLTIYMGDDPDVRKPIEAVAVELGYYPPNYDLAQRDGILACLLSDVADSLGIDLYE